MIALSVFKQAGVFIKLDLEFKKFILNNSRYSKLRNLFQQKNETFTKNNEINGHEMMI
jgi:hypothetical protein